jgi:hypothetical protein
MVVVNIFANIQVKDNKILDKIFHNQRNNQSPDVEGGDGLRNVGLLSTTDTACCPRGFYLGQSP